MEVFHFPLSDNVTDQSDLYWAWALTPLPAPASPADSAFLRIRLMAPDAALTRAAVDAMGLGVTARPAAIRVPPRQAQPPAVLPAIAAHILQGIAGAAARWPP